ncbi:type IV toxin-antitoxin system AbiEi family antitoxin domain-containing protein [Luedemannella helvata]|uniref:Type IV toxin-antitoxin system AbiEi family antitoxin domain-containing protein n=1 Tax=Luedemannella helvata TaxID=349315 RepID=A0ABP4VSI8_9ACTN
MNDGSLRRLADAQDGLFTRAQATACGYSAYQIRQRTRSGAWQHVLGQVLALPGVSVTPAARDRAALLAVGGLLAGPSAARRWGIWVPDDRTCLAVPVGCHPRVGNLVLIRVPVAAVDRRVRGGLPVTSVGRTIVDCVRLLPDTPAVDMLDRAMRERRITFDDLCGRVRDDLGRAGTPRLVRLIRLLGSGARSAAERRAVVLLRNARINGWVANMPIYDDAGLIGVGDLVFAEVKLVVELDGWAYHSARADFERDRSRQNRLVAAGWTVLRFTWRDVTQRPDHVAATIRGLLARTR